MKCYNGKTETDNKMQMQKHWLKRQQQVFMPSFLFSIYFKKSE